MMINRRIFTTALSFVTIALMPTLVGAAQYNLKLATGVARPHPFITMGEYFKKEIERQSNGEVAVQIFTVGQLGSQRDHIEQVRLGTIDLTIQTTANTAGFAREFQLFNLQYLFPDYGTFRKVVGRDSPVFKRFAAITEKRLNAKLLALSGGGTRSIGHRSKRIRTPADLNGAKFRIPPSPVEAKNWGAQGAVPVRVPFKEIYTAVQTGVVDAFEGSESAFAGSKLYEVAPYRSLTQHLFMTCQFTISLATYKRLPPKYRKLAVEIGNKASKVGIDAGLKADSVLLNGLVKKHGVVVTRPDKAAFRRNVVPLHDELAKSFGGTDLLATVRKMM